MSERNDRNNPAPAGMDALLDAAGRQLHQDPQRLRAQLENGQLQEVLRSLPPQRSEKINRLLQDPQQLEKLLRSPQVKSLLETLGRRQ